MEEEERRVVDVESSCGKHSTSFHIDLPRNLAKSAPPPKSLEGLWSISERKLMLHVEIEAERKLQRRMDGSSKSKSRSKKLDQSTIYERISTQYLLAREADPEIFRRKKLATRSVRQCLDELKNDAIVSDVLSIVVNSELDELELLEQQRKEAEERKKQKKANGDEKNKMNGQDKEKEKEEEKKKSEEDKDASKRVEVSTTLSLLDEGKVEIVLTGEGFRDILHVDLASIAKQSETIEMMANATTIRRFTISENSAEFKGKGTFHFLRGSNFSRFVVFAQYPDIYHTLFEAEDNLDGILKKRQTYRDCLMRDIVREKEERITRVEDAREEQLKSAEDSLNEMLENDIRKLQSVYQEAIENEKELVNQKFAIARGRIETYFDREVSLVRDYIDRCFSKSVEESEKNLEGVNTIASEVFVKGDVVRLCILAEALNVENLKYACIQLISRHFDEYKESRHLGSRLLEHSTLLSILSRLSDRVIRDLATAEVCHIPLFLVRKELKCRRDFCEEKYKSMGTDELIALQKRAKWPEETSNRYAEEEVVFMDILDREIESRREKRSIVTFPLENYYMPRTHHTGLPGGDDDDEDDEDDDFLLPRTEAPFTVSEGKEGVVVVLRAVNRYVTIWASETRDNKVSRGKGYFEVVIVGMPAYGSSIMIGMDSWKDLNVLQAKRRRHQREMKSKLFIEESLIPGRSQDAEGKYGVSWQFDGLCHFQGDTVATDVCFDQGDTIGIAVDQDRRTIQFFRNGELLKFHPDVSALMWSARDGYALAPELDPCEYVPIIPPQSYTVVPCLCMYQTQEDRRCEVTVNFGGPFVYPLPLQHKSYGVKKITR